MTAGVERVLSVIEFLSTAPEGKSVAQIAQGCGLVPSATHRLLKDLEHQGYVRQIREQGDYALTLRFAAMGLGYLARTGVTDVAQPVLDGLAAQSRELVRLSVYEAPDLVWVAVAQGATGGLRYDPASEQGLRVPLTRSASGLAWLMAQDEITVPPDEEAISGKALKDILSLARIRGYAVSVDRYHLGMAAMAAPIRAASGQVIGCLSIAGPAVRLTEARMADLAPALLAATKELGAMAAASFFLRRAKQ